MSTTYPRARVTRGTGRYTDRWHLTFHPAPGEPPLDHGYHQHLATAHDTGARWVTAHRAYQKALTTYQQENP